MQIDHRSGSRSPIPCGTKRSFRYPIIASRNRIGNALRINPSGILQGAGAISLSACTDRAHCLLYRQGVHKISRVVAAICQQVMMEAVADVVDKKSATVAKRNRAKGAPEALRHAGLPQAYVVDPSIPEHPSASVIGSSQQS